MRRYMFLLALLACAIAAPVQAQFKGYSPRSGGSFRLPAVQPNPIRNFVTSRPTTLPPSIHVVPKATVSASPQMGNFKLPSNIRVPSYIQPTSGMKLPSNIRLPNGGIRLGNSMTGVNGIGGGGFKFGNSISGTRRVPVGLTSLKSWVPVFPASGHCPTPNWCLPPCLNVCVPYLPPCSPGCLPPCPPPCNPVPGNGDLPGGGDDAGGGDDIGDGDDMGGGSDIGTNNGGGSDIDSASAAPMYGLKVTQLGENMPAEKMGIKVGDVLLAIGNNRLESFDQMVEAISKLKSPTDVYYIKVETKSVEKVTFTPAGGKLGVAVEPIRIN
jgi:membrane-associated protease RseP (regulator of RpoE activity)